MRRVSKAQAMVYKKGLYCSGEKKHLAQRVFLLIRDRDNDFSSGYSQRKLLVLKNYCSLDSCIV